MKILLFAFFLSVATNAIADDQKDRQAAVSIIKAIVGTCETQGMFACEKNIVGVDPLFHLLHLFDDVRKTELAFNEFLQRRYPSEGNVRFYVLDASLRLSMDIKFRTNQFVQDITKVRRVANGYELTLGNKDSLTLRKDSTQWYVQFPESKAREIEEQFEPYRLAAALKRSILVYRMLEADMANLNRSELEKNVSEDLAPIVVALLGKEKFPAVTKWLVKEPKDVLVFYQQFNSIEDMKKNIRKVHHLS